MSLSESLVRDLNDKCETCGNSWGWHQETKPIHPFNDGTAGGTAFLGKRGDRTRQRNGSSPQNGSETPPKQVWPSDPVLRVALINAGVISAEQLATAEATLQSAMSAVLAGGAPWSAQGAESTGSSIETGKTSTEP